MECYKVDRAVAKTARKLLNVIDDVSNVWYNNGRPGQVKDDMA